MKIAVNTENTELYSVFVKLAKEYDHEILNAKVENTLFDIIEKEEVNVYVLSNFNYYFKKSVDLIKRKNLYVPIIGIIISNLTFDVTADIYINEPMKFEGGVALHNFVMTVFFNLSMYTKNFSVLNKLTSKIHENIEFSNCMYDPTRRILYHSGKEIEKLSVKKGAIIEVLASNYGQIVKKDIIMERVWRKTDYFTSRSLDVFLSYIRNTFKENNINLQIINISGVGLMLE